MVVLLAGLFWSLLIGWLVWRAVRQFAAHQVASLAAGPGVAPAARFDVSIVVPARNEIDNIEACLASLSAQAGLDDARIIVVDDGSQDGTRHAVLRAAVRDRRIALIDAGQLPGGWLGKPHACWRGAESTAAEWLCFIDADVRAAPELVRSAISAAERGGIDMLSLNPSQLLGSFWERLIIPAGLVLIGCAKDLRLINDPTSSEVSANGQFILIRRAVYQAVGGHAAVRGEVCEDKALAALIKRGGWRLRLLGAEQLAQTRMYTNLPALWEGFAKNAIEIMGDANSTAAAATAGMILGWLVMLFPVFAGLGLFQLHSTAAMIGVGLAAAGSLAALGVQAGTCRHFHVPVAYALLLPFAYTVVATLALYSVALKRRGRVSWKGRRYQLAPPT